MTRAEITTPEALSEESVVELSLRPQRLAEFIGQQKVKESLRHRRSMRRSPGASRSTTRCSSARRDWARRRSPSSSRASCGVNIRTTSGPALEKPGDLVGTLTNLREGDILFIDEIHRLRPIIEEFLYPAMEDYRIDIRLSEGPKAQTITMPIERFTLIGATTRLGMLTPPMRARFGIVQRLNYYPAEDLELIVRRTAEVLKVEIDRGRRAARSPGARAARRASRTGCCAACATTRRCAPTARITRGRRARRRCDARRGPVRPRRHGRAHPEGDHREVRRRAGRHRDDRRRRSARTRARSRRCTSRSSSRTASCSARRAGAWRRRMAYRHFGYTPPAVPSEQVVLF